jgi:hypothetical protein
LAVASQIGKQETVENVHLLGNPERPWHEDHGTFGKMNVLRAGKMRKHGFEGEVIQHSILASLEISL